MIRVKQVVIINLATTFYFVHSSSKRSGFWTLVPRGETFLFVGLLNFESGV